MTHDGTLQAPPAGREVAETTDKDKRAEEIRKVEARLIIQHTREGVPKVRKLGINADRIIRHDPYFVRRLKMNGLSEAVEWNGERLRDDHVTWHRFAILDTNGGEFSFATISEVLVSIALPQIIPPVARYLTRIRWDGERRIDRYLVDYLGAADTPLHRAISRRWFISCVARAMGKGERPVQCDTVLVLAGPQGARKSTSFRVLTGSNWFSDTALDLRSKDSLLAIKGTCIYELAGLAAVRPRDAETVKAFLSAQTDQFRPPYGRSTICSHRQCVFVGTTNEANFISDPTGARRLWPVTVGRIDVDAIQRDRNMLWAEAVAAWKVGEPWWLTPEEDQTLRESQERYRHEDPRQAAIEQWMEEPPNVSRANRGLRIADVLVDVLEMDTDKQGKHHEMRLSGVLQSMGWGKRRRTRGGSRVWVWLPPSTEAK